MANPSGTINADENHTGRTIIKSDPTVAQDAATKAYADSIAGGGVNAFGTIAVSGQSNVVADAAPDTLTLVAGTNVTLTTNASTDTITIAASGGGGSGTVTTTGTPATGNLSKFSGATSITNGDLTGDVTTSGGVATTIANNAVTLGKMATMATDSILGRATATTGNVEVLTALPFAYTGDVTRPADSNATTIANSAVTYAKIQNVSANSKLLGSSASGSGAPPSEITLGTNLSMSGSTLNATGAGGGGYWDATYQIAGSDFTTSSATAVDVTGLSHAASASSLYEIECTLDFQSSNTGGAEFTINFSAAGASGHVRNILPSAQITSNLGAYYNNLGAFPPMDSGITANVDFIGLVSAMVRTGANAGNITLQTKKTSSGTLTIFQGSIMKVKKLR